MKMNLIKFEIMILVILFGVSILLLTKYPEKFQADPLPSWNDGPVKQKIIEFVQNASDKNNPKFIPISQRIATFDNDGTLWVEQPIYTQVIYAMDKVKGQIAKISSGPLTEKTNAMLSNYKVIFNNLTKEYLASFVSTLYGKMSNETFHQDVRNWLAKTNNSHFNRPYISLVYQPMLELMDYLREHGFKTYIVTGGGQEFVRSFSEGTYGIPPEQVIGTALKTEYTYSDGKPILIKLPIIQIYSNKDGKPEAINLMIGQIPVFAIGNSDGDRQMLEWTQSNPLPHFMALVHHDDAVREFAYGPESKVGTFSESLMQEAKQQGWHIISMKNDWKVIFPPERNK